MSCWEEIVFGHRNAPEPPDGFPHIVHLSSKGAKSPGVNQSEKLRFVKFFNMNNLEQHRDFRTANWFKDNNHMTSFAFKNPNMAMLFKLSFTERA